LKEYCNGTTEAGRKTSVNNLVGIKGVNNIRIKSIPVEIEKMKLSALGAIEFDAKIFR
jgi:hypothetical protein